MTGRTAARRPGSPGQLQPVHLRHLQVGEHEADLLVARQRASAPAVPCRDHAVAGRLEDAALQLPDGERVLDDEDSAWPAGAPGRLPRRALAAPRARARTGQDRAMRPSSRIRRAEVAVHARERGPERLDDELLLAEQRVARTATRRPPGADDDGGRPSAWARRVGADEIAETAAEPRDREARGGPAAERVRLSTVTTSSTPPAAAPKTGPALEEQYVEQSERERKRSMTSVPRRARCARRALPPSDSVPLTASRPTPRPASAVTRSPVVKPGRARTSASEPSPRPSSRRGRRRARRRRRDLDEAAALLGAQLDAAARRACRPARSAGAR